ncbi:hypothetical protein L1D41_10240 [Vibrio harveyi]|uniref:hypothetical protein n=1 Tax=Vibrio harveyi TaxID=669 RepID=UPI001EFC6B12|nr:hypothetical protein [Vibrio harveyi]MCG9610065.1 hypothetical protein [Vibrio harveyi]MCG9671675.1 hypothetical protein [Vibrio harveyi]
MISFTENMLNIMLPIIKNHHSQCPIILETKSSEYRIIAIKSTFMDFDSNGTLVSVEVGGEVYLENQTALEYVITNGTASFTELAKSAILTNSF